MALLKPPDPETPRRKYYVRIEEPLALTMERYAEFLGTTTTDHVIRQALQFVFRKDSDFKQWLEQHPDPSPRQSTHRKLATGGSETGGGAGSGANGRGGAGA